MLTRFIATLIAAALSLGIGASLSWAVDIPKNGDAVYYQLRASSAAVIAKLVRVSKKGYTFEVTHRLFGRGPRTIVLAEDGQLREYGLRASRSYLLYLREFDRKIGLATSIYSIQSVSKGEVPAYRAAINSYLVNRRKPAALKPVLMKQAQSDVRYLQYSAVADLNKLRLLDKNDVANLAKLLESKRIVDSRARVLVVQSIASAGLRRFVPLLESLATNKAESTHARGAAITALHQLNATASLRKIGPSIAAEGSPALMLRLLPEEAEKVRK